MTECTHAEIEETAGGGCVIRERLEYTPNRLMRLLGCKARRWTDEYRTEEGILWFKVPDYCLCDAETGRRLEDARIERKMETRHAGSATDEWIVVRFGRDSADSVVRGFLGRDAADAAYAECPARSYLCRTVKRPTS